MRERKISGTQMEEGGGKSRLENLSLTFGQTHLYICTFVLLDIVTFVLFYICTFVQVHLSDSFVQVGRRPQEHPCQLEGWDCNQTSDNLILIYVYKK